jgi:tetratricopeptide (TPR) repeat protein
MCPLMAAIAVGQTSWNNGQGDSPRRIAARLYQYYVDAKNKGDFKEAKARLDRMILENPNHFGNYYEKSKLCFEMEEFAEAAKAYNRFKDRFPLKDQPVGLLASNFVMETLIQSTKSHREPDWRPFSTRFGRKTSLTETLLQTCYEAIVDNRTRTAAVLIGELEKLRVPASDLDGMRSNLKKRIESRSSDKR